MTPRRIVTGHDERGRSTILYDSPLQGGAFRHTPGFEVNILWRTPPLPTIAPRADDAGAAIASVLPDAGGTTALLVCFPPDSAPGADFDPAAAGAEFAERLPGLAECFEPDAPGFHRSATIDYGVVIEGEIWLELDDGVTRHLRQGDVIVQRGTRHAWRNRGSKPARLLFTLIGAESG
ncbi:cupin domain-containing protein [Azoarcus olearius]|uniref:Cupin type-2 domain-containing protein n=1 Tax=Azoarcus sp. (strain BH72) TaxID=418699 RepID=A1K6Y2_AZOSB|nr:cupin domain-containing protein [Azoarcus olearius]ANQ85162.1 hypothetical protein dqs_2125 [Azoarcus olearius]CAL94587.1 conserved hypothetical protein [Azoarcus olearius]